MYSKITQLLNLVSETEWSALLFFKATGHPRSPETFTCELVDLHLQDIGTPGFTTYKNDKDAIIDLYDEKPHLLDCRLGIIHSHHKMQTFYSSDDMEELHTNCQGVDFYLSVVVNNSPLWIAKAVFEVEEKAGEMSWREDGEIKKSESGKTRTVFHETDLEIVSMFPDAKLAKRVMELRKAKVVVGTRFPDYTKRGGLENHINLLHPAEDDFERWRSKRGIPEHVSRNQIDLFEGKTLAELVNSDNSRPTLEDIAKSCLSLQADEHRSIEQVIKKIQQEIVNENVEMWITEVMDNLEIIYGEMTGDDLSETSRNSLLRMMSNLLPDYGFQFDAMKQAIETEIEIQE